MLQPFPYTDFRFGVFFLCPQFNFNGNFKSVGGLGFNSGTTARIEGGVGGFKHQLTDIGTYKNLTLTRGFTDDNQLYQWCNKTHNTLRTEPCNILISLLDKQGLPVKNWLIFHAIPKSWDAGSLNADSNQIIMESVSFSYRNFILI